MRLWSLHPGYLDRHGLLGLWREALLAQKVLLGETRGYRMHPQLFRFRQSPDPLAAIGSYLRVVGEEALRRGYSFDANRIIGAGDAPPIEVTTGQLEFERRHLIGKLERREPARVAKLADPVTPLPHPLFRSVPGPIEPWERGVP